MYLVCTIIRKGIRKKAYNILICWSNWRSDGPLDKSINNNVINHLSLSSVTNIGRIAQSVEHWTLDQKVPGSNPVRVDSALHRSWSIKWVAQRVEVTGSLCWGLFHPTKMYANLELYSLAQGYRKGISSSILWLLALRSINPLPFY